jgi:hypothetical protein
MKCIYCGVNESTAEFDGMACGCPDSPEYLRVSAPAAPAKRRCPDCGEFAADCACTGRASRGDHEHGYGGRAANVGGED